MKFRDLFNEDMTLNFKKIRSIKEFSCLKNVIECNVTEEKKKESIQFSVYKHTEKVVFEMAKCLDDMGVDKKSDYYIMMMSAALCHDLGKTTNLTNIESGKNGSNICRKIFYDNDILMRESVCYMVRNFPYFIEMFTNDTLVKTIIKLSWGHVNVKDFLILFSCDYMATTSECDKSDLTYKMRFVTKMSNDIKCYNVPYVFDNVQQKNEFFYQIENVDYKKGKRFTVYFMVGLPGAGKDTYITKKLHGIPTVCRDEIRSEIGISGVKPQGTKKEEDIVTKITNERVIDLCEKRISFIINNTNLKKEYRDSFEKMILPYKPKIVFIYVEAPNVEENKNRRYGQIQSNVIERMSKSFDFPEPHEYDEIRYDIQR